MMEIIKNLLLGKSVLRILMNQEFRNFELRGEVLDLGGGENPSYLEYFRLKDVNILSIDFKSRNEKLRMINLEKDKLPFNDESFDCVLMINILEHIFNFRFFLSEARRVLKREKRLIGFVPFLINYHPDPHDYFRYTDEALKKIFNEAGFSKIEIKPIGKGPFSASFNNVMFYIPKFLRPFIFLPFLWIDCLLVRLKSEIKIRHSLGYAFILEK